MSLLYAVHQQYKLLVYTSTCSEVGRLCMSPTKAVIEGTASLHSTQGVGVGVGVV